MSKTILYIDMDGVVADFNTSMNKLAPHIPLGDGADYEERSAKLDKIVQHNPTFFETLELIEGALEAIEKLKEHYDIYFLSTPMCKVPSSYMGKRIWIMDKFGAWADKRLILTHRKDLVIGDILIDDRDKHGAGDFRGILIRFGSEKFPSWKEVYSYLLAIIGY